MFYRHEMNMYTGVALSGVYTRSPGVKDLSKSSLKEEIYKALSIVVHGHPALALTLHLPEVMTDKQVPTFQLLEKVDLANHVIWAAQPQEQKEEEEEVAVQLAKSFEHIDRVPPWRLLVCSSQDGNRVSVSFLYHHSVGDGTSGRVFLEDLCDALNHPLLPSSPSPSPATPNTEVLIPKDAAIQPALETVLPMPQSWLTMLTTLAKEFGPLTKTPRGLWTGTPCTDTVALGRPVRPLVKRFAIGKEDMGLLASECKRRGTTVTAVVTALLVVALDRVFLDSEKEGTGLSSREYKMLSCAIPRNLRSLIDPAQGVPEDGMGVYVAGMEVVLNRSDLHPSPSSSPISEAEATAAAVWFASKATTAVIQKALSRQNYDLNTGMLKYAGPIRKLLEGCIGKTRSASLEVSSLQAPIPAHAQHPTQPKQGQWTLDDMYFTQPANAISAPVTVSTVGYKGGALNMTCVWAPEFVEDAEIGEKVVRKFGETLRVVMEAIE